MKKIQNTVNLSEEEFREKMKILMTTEECKCGNRCRPGYVVCDNCWQKKWGKDT